jgi:hypothetical protein
MAKTATRTASRTQAAQVAASVAHHAEQDTGESVITLNGSTRAKFCLFAIPEGERVEDGPVMRGFLETDAGKVNVAGWKKFARDSGNEYLSLKVGNTKKRDDDTPEDAPDEWLVGPFYGRLFKEITVSRGEKRTRYFGFVEDSVKTGEDEATGKGIYRTNWQVQVRAKPDVSGDGRTRYINGSAYPKDSAPAASSNDNGLPF